MSQSDKSPLFNTETKNDQIRKKERKITEKNIQNDKNLKHYEMGDAYQSDGYGTQETTLRVEISDLGKMVVKFYALFTHFYNNDEKY